MKKKIRSKEDKKNNKFMTHVVKVKEAINFFIATVAFGIFLKKNLHRGMYKKKNGIEHAWNRNSLFCTNT